MSEIKEKFIKAVESLPYDLDKEILKKRYKRYSARSDTKIC